MKKSAFISVVFLAAINVISLSQVAEKYVSSKTHIKFFSKTPAEDIEANNYASVSIFNTKTGEGIFSVPMQSFEFEKALMQEHFNNKNFLSTKDFPEAKLNSKITNIDDIDFSKDGSYEANISGDITIKGKTNPVSEKATITVKGNQVNVQSKLNITLADYEIVFVKGKPSSNIAKTVEVTVHAEYQPE